MNHDQIRREARATIAPHDASMPMLHDAMHRFLDRESRTADETSRVLLGGLSRRNLLRIGGMSIAGAAILAACGSDSKDTASSSSAAPGTMAPSTEPMSTEPMATEPMTTVAMSSDVVMLRTVSSLEHLAVAAYQIAIDSGLVTTAAIGDAAKLFQSQHMEHAAFFEGATKQAGGDPFTDPNPAVLAQLQPSIDALKDENGVVALALMLEQAAASTYQANVGTVMDLTLNKALMSVGGVEARHAAVLAGVLGQPPVPRSFGSVEGAVPSGTGV